MEMVVYLIFQVDLRRPAMGTSRARGDGISSLKAKICHSKFP